MLYNVIALEELGTNESDGSLSNVISWIVDDRCVLNHLPKRVNSRIYWPNLFLCGMN